MHIDAAYAGSAFICPEFRHLLDGVQVRFFISYLRDRICSTFSGDGKFYLANGLRQFTWDIKSDVRILNFRSVFT